MGNSSPRSFSLSVYMTDSLGTVHYDRHRSARLPPARLSLHLAHQGTPALCVQQRRLGACPGQYEGFLSNRLTILPVLPATITTGNSKAGPRVQTAEPEEAVNLAATVNLAYAVDLLPPVVSPLLHSSSCRYLPYMFHIRPVQS